MDIIINSVLKKSPKEGQSIQNYGDYFLNFLACLGYPSAMPPLGDLLRRYHGLEGQWIVASPIYWQATHNDAMIIAVGESLKLFDGESRQFFLDVADYFKEDGLDLFYHDAKTWLLKIDKAPAINAKSPYEMLHQSIMPILSQLDASLFWQRKITELQMYCSGHALNAEREIPVNGLWFWGTGEFKFTGDQRIITDDKSLLSCFKRENWPIEKLGTTHEFHKSDLILIKNRDDFHFKDLQEKIDKHNVHYYWSNLAYLKKTKHWWSKLWR